MGSGKTVGAILMGIGVVVFLTVAAFIGSGIGNGLNVSGAILGIALFGVLPLLLLGGGGLYLWMRGQQEAREMTEVRKKERLLGIIQAQGKVSLSTMMIESKMGRDDIKTAIYDLVNLGLFSGYIDWQSQTFYSQDAARVGSNKCPNCGGVRELVGKGIVKCPYCGVELFVPPDAPQTVATPAQPTNPPATAQEQSSV
jgi:DNA-directed RNA polymerase subunit RPC12/RpoP